MEPLRIVVYGQPATQGSKRYVGQHRATGRALLIEQTAERIRTWRADVVAAAREAIRCRCEDPSCTGLATGFPVDGPVVARMVFTVARPASAPKRRRTWPSRRLDLSKLVRAVEDALTAAGVWADDARVVNYTRLAKVYPGEDPEALPVPGVRIEVCEVTP